MKQNKRSHIRSQQQNCLHFQIILLLVIPLLLFCFIWEAPQWHASSISNIKDRIIAENSTRDTLLRAIGGFFFFVTGFFSWRNIQIAQEKQVTERFAKAIEQLGSENIHVRLGAIYALERIARDSNKDYWQVMEILTAYVRERAPYPARKEDTSNQPLWLQVQKLHKKENYVSATENSGDKDITPIETDIQAVLTVISRRTKSYEKFELDKLNLSATNLSSANFISANLISVNLNSANLSSVKFIDAILRDAILRDAILRGANLFSADLSNTDLSNTDLINADLCGAELINTRLISANLSNAELINTSLIDAKLGNANLNGANLSGAKFWNKKSGKEAQNITPEQIKQAKFWEEAVYSPQFRKELGLPPEKK